MNKISLTFVIFKICITCAVNRKHTKFTTNFYQLL